MKHLQKFEAFNKAKIDDLINRGYNDLNNIEKTI